MQMNEISDKEFKRIQTLIFEWAGITMADSKKGLVVGRLAKRLRFYELDSYEAYLHILANPAESQERQTFIDLLTTNETYFFRESKHFDLLEKEIVPAITARPLRVWSAACSTGAEPYTLAMVLANKIGFSNWEIMATDISNRVLGTAKAGLYPLESAEKIPAIYRNKFCLKGVRSQEGSFIIDERLRRGIDFRYLNLNGKWPELGKFHIIFLRNVMIYFNQDTKRQLVQRMAQLLLPGGYFIVGHSESLTGINVPGLSMVSPSVYRMVS